jgi:hypothetical protein
MERPNAGNDQTFAGVFLIGLALLFITGYWWPGILFVIGIAMVVRTVRDGGQWQDDRSAVGLLAIGAVFAVLDLLGNIDLSGAFWPIILIAIGVYLLFGKNKSIGTRKSKNDDLL